MGENGPSNAVDAGGNHGTDGAQNGRGQSAGTRYEVGPGFEIAIRSALNRPVDVQVKNEGNPQKPPQRSGDLDHRHETIEKRLDAIERALFIMVDQLKRIDDQVAAVARRVA